MQVASVPPHKEDIARLTGYLVTQLEELGVKVKVNTAVTTALVRAEKPDVVVLAAGSSPARPAIEGVTGQNVVTAQDVLAGRAVVGETVSVLGGGRVGCEVAEFLAERGKKVTIVEILDKVASGMGVFQGRDTLLKILAEKKVTIMTRARTCAVSSKGLSVTGSTGAGEVVAADTVVLACGSLANDGLADELRGICPELHVIGDCLKPRGILEAIDDAARIGRLL